MVVQSAATCDSWCQNRSSQTTILFSHWKRYCRRWYGIYMEGIVGPPKKEVQGLLGLPEENNLGPCVAISTPNSMSSCRSIGQFSWRGRTVSIGKLVCIRNRKVGQASSHIMLCAEDSAQIWDLPFRVGNPSEMCQVQQALEGNGLCRKMKDWG